MSFNAFRFLYIHLLFYHPIQEFCLDIHMVNLPSHLRCKGYDESDWSIPSYWGEGFFIVYPFFLSIPLSYKLGFKFLYTAICSIFNLVDPSRTHNQSVLRSRNYFPDIICHDGVILLHHCIYPHLMLSCLLKTKGFPNLGYQGLVSVRLPALPLLISRSSNKLLCIPQSLL